MQYYAILCPRGNEFIDEKTNLSYRLGQPYGPVQSGPSHRAVEFENIWLDYRENETLVFEVEVTGDPKQYKNMPGSRFFSGITLTKFVSHNQLIEKSIEQRPNYAFDRVPLLSPVTPFGKVALPPASTNRDLGALAAWVSTKQMPRKVLEQSWQIQKRYQREAILTKFSRIFDPLINPITYVVSSGNEQQIRIAKLWAKNLQYGAIGMIFDECQPFSNPLRHLFDRGYIPASNGERHFLLGWEQGRPTIKWSGVFSKLQKT